MVVQLKSLRLPLAVFLMSAFLLAVVQLKVHRPMLIAERFYVGAGWVQIVLMASWGAFMAFKMQNPQHTARFRQIAWITFTTVFFSQLALGLAGYTIFLMTGKLHLPIPAMIIGGPAFRHELSFMTILFVSTVLLTGPAWCSQYCYFGALDGLLSGKKVKGKRQPIKYKWLIKSTILPLFIITALLFRWFGLNPVSTTLFASAFGVVGLLIILFVSPRKGKMIHCTTYCPIGTVVSITKQVNPFRMVINSSCTSCMRCMPACKYDALNIDDIKRGKPALTCTLCGDCVSTCKPGAIQYRFPGLSAETARMFYLFLTISTYVVFLSLGRI